MVITRNKDGEAWDDTTGFVYNEDGGVLRKGIVGTPNDYTKAEAAAAIADLDGE